MFFGYYCFFDGVHAAIARAILVETKIPGTHALDESELLGRVVLVHMIFQPLLLAGQSRCFSHIFGFFCFLDKLRDLLESSLAVNDRWPRQMAFSRAPSAQ